MKHLPQAGGDRPHLRPGHPRRHLDGSEALIDELAGEVDVGAVTEGDDHHRQAEHAGAADVFEPRHPPHRQFHREGDLPLYLFGHHPGSDGVDLHLHRRGVGEGIDDQPAHGYPADKANNGRAEEDHEAPRQRPGNDGVEHDGGGG